jgi:hypothetical protein
MNLMLILPRRGVDLDTFFDNKVSIVTHKKL